MTEAHWQLDLVSKSLKKKEKLKILAKDLKIAPSSRILDLGCAQGILSHFLRQKGGHWISADLDFTNVSTSRKLLKKNIIQIAEGTLPVKNAALDLVVTLDYLEHLENDQLCLDEIHRILKDEGVLLLAVPRSGRLFLLNRLRPLLGIRPEHYGHKREGYSLQDIRSRLEASRLSYIRHTRFAGFLTEATELLLNWLYIRFFPESPSQDLRDGRIRPSTSEEFASKKRLFRFYGFIYPLIWLFTRLDRLFFFQRGYGLMVWARKAGKTID